ncbi:SAVED domain-containing protein [Leptolyngbya sp. AN03gr2]|uniref:SAVED domain-containing protein n=1 Tax=unclassified Leptolyngbya TaxID=2650499 RepID=UPI003D316E9A
MQNVDFAIVTALKVERDAVLKRLDSSQLVQDDYDPLSYYLGHLDIPGSSQRYTIVVLLLLDMGNDEAASATMQLLNRWHPNYVLMVGIAGGVRGQVELGDVVVAKYAFYYEQAKLTPEGEQLRSEQFPSDRLLYGRTYTYEISEWHRLIDAIRPGESGEQQIPSVHFAPIASGEKVIADEETISKLVRACPKLAAVAMEGAGVARAARTYPKSPGYLEIRGICDFADPQKNDNWHEYAANAAASFTVGWLRSCPVPPLENVHSNQVLNEKISNRATSANQHIADELQGVKRQRLETKHAHLHSEWETRNEKLAKLRQALILETSADRQFQLEKQIQKEEEGIEHLESELLKIEQILISTVSSTQISSLQRQVSKPLLILCAQSLRAIAPDEILTGFDESLQQRERQFISLDFTRFVQGGVFTNPEQAVQQLINPAGVLLGAIARSNEAELVFHGLVHIPLLILMGHLVSDRISVRLFEFLPNTDSSSWAWGDPTQPFPRLESYGIPNQQVWQAKDVILRVSVSYSISASQAAIVAPEGAIEIDLTLSNPERSIVRSEAQVREYGQIFRRTLDLIAQKLPPGQRIHLFYAGPVSLGFHLGQQISENIHPSVIVWNYHRQYDWAIDLSTAYLGEECIVRPE